MLQRALRLLKAWALVLLSSPLLAQEWEPPSCGSPAGWSRSQSVFNSTASGFRRVAGHRYFSPPSSQSSRHGPTWSQDPGLRNARDGELLAPAPINYRLPGEFERQGTLFLGCGELATFFPDVLADVVDAVRHRVDVAALVVDDAGRQVVVDILRKRGLPTDAVRYVETPHDTMWIRDYGPLFVRRTSDGQAVVIDTDYQRFARPRDDHAPHIVAAQLQVATVKAPVAMEGGNLLSNGQGVCLSTTVLLDCNQKRGYTEDHVRDLLREYFGAEQTLFLEPLVGEPTGHVDMFAVFANADTVLVGEYDPFVDPVNAALLDRNAARLARVRLPRSA